MGRTLPSATQIIFEQIAELKGFYGILRCSDQLILDRFFEAMLEHRVPISDAANLLPMEVMIIAIPLEQRKRIDSLCEEFRSRIEESGKRLNKL
jgi:hypothetical protein